MHKRLIVEEEEEEKHEVEVADGKRNTRRTNYRGGRKGREGS